MFDGFKHVLIDLGNSENGIFLELLDSKDFVDIFAEIHPFYSLLTATHLIDPVSFNYLFKFLFCKI